MKTTHALIHALLFKAATLFMCLWAAMPQMSRAAAADGVRCPNGYESQYEAGSKTLRCKRSENAFRPAVCDPKFSDHIVYRTNKGRDSCLNVNDAAQRRAEAANDPRGRAVVCSIDSNDSTQWVIDIDPNSQDRDRCKTTSVEWIYPSQQ